MASSIDCQDTCSNHHHYHHHHHHHLEVSPDCPFHGFHLQSTGHGNHNHHQHHHLELSPQCPLHSFLLHLRPTNHHHLLSHFPPHTHPNNRCPNFTSPVPFTPSTNPQPTVSISSLHDSNSPVPDPSEIIYSHSLNEELDPEDEEFDFVLTDEWKEFFAKSEAKRRSAKKHAKRRGKE